MQNLTKLENLYLDRNRIESIEPLRHLQNISYGDLFSQEIILPTVQLAPTETSITVENVIKDENGNYVTNIDAEYDGGTYDPKTNIVRWDNLTEDVSQVEYFFSHVNDNITFNGTVIQPIEWVTEKETPEEKTVQLNKETPIFANETLTIGDTGATITAPANLPDGTTIEIKLANEENFVKNAANLERAGDVFTITLNIDSFDGEFTLSIPYEGNYTEKDGLGIYYYDGTKWVKQDGEINNVNKTITIYPEHFSTYGVFVEKNSDTVPEENDDNENERTEQRSDDETEGTNETEEEIERKEEDKQVNVTVEGSDDDNKNAENAGDNTLPKTASSFFNWILAGLLALTAGIVGVVVQRKHALARK